MIVMESPSAVAAARCLIRIITVHRGEGPELPIFCSDDVRWLLTPTLLTCTTERLCIGVALCELDDAYLDVLVLSHRQRMLLIQLPQAHNEEWQDTQGEERLGVDCLTDLLLCSGADCESLSNVELKEKIFADWRISLASLSASRDAYLLFCFFEVHTCLIDLEVLGHAVGYPKASSFNPVDMLAIVLGRRLERLLSLKPRDFEVYRRDTTIENAFLTRLMDEIHLAIGSYDLACLFLESCQTNIDDGAKAIESATLDTRRVPLHLIEYISRFETVEAALYLAKPKTGRTQLQRQVDAKGLTKGIICSLADDGKSIEVINEQYKSRLTKSYNQVLEIALKDDTGHIKVYHAKTVGSNGKTSRLAFVGKNSSEAMQKLRHGAVATAEKIMQSDRLGSIEVHGREDHSPLEIDGMRWRRRLLCPARAADSQAGIRDLEAQRISSAFLLGHPFPEMQKETGKLLSRLMSRTENHGYHCIAKREVKGVLNTSQAKAARAILSPLPGPCNQKGGDLKSIKTHKKGDQRRAQGPPEGERMILIHGPPGTGKTSLVTACCEQWQQSCASTEGGSEMAVDSIYACCQSNVAVKNIAESFSRSRIQFKIIVSPNFYVDWHEDLYTDIQSRLIRSDELPSSPSKLDKLLCGCSVILSTLSFLSSPKVVAKQFPLFILRPMRLLFVDEASQIHLRAYPQLFHRFGHGLARIVFLGDDRQLSPFQGEEIIDAGLSVFELEHLRSKAFLLDTCYRLARPLAEFISVNIYDSLLLCGSENHNPRRGLLDCVSFIDVESSKEESHGTSRLNAAEVLMVTRLLSEFKKRGGLMADVKVLTTYDAQRDALEEALRKEDLSGASDTVFSVDSFQGRESPYIILSLVKDGRPIYQEDRRKGPRALPTKILQPGIGFLSNDRRMNVALTRAKNGIVVVSNRRFILEAAADTLVGKMQVELQWKGDGGQAHWWHEDDIRNARWPYSLFENAPLPSSDGVADLNSQLPKTTMEK